MFLRRQASLQYLTSCHVLAHLRRQVIGRWQTMQVLVSCRFMFSAASFVRSTSVDDPVLPGMCRTETPGVLRFRSG